MPKAKTAQSRAETTEQQAPSGAGNKENSPLQFDVRIQSIRPGESIRKHQRGICNPGCQDY